MFRIQPNQKQIDKYLSGVSNLKPIPHSWEDFIRLTTIRSGGQMKTFEAYDYQKLIIKLASQYPNMIILKSRQLGITQAIVSKFLHDACLNQAASSICFMRNGEDASAVSRRTRQMLQSCSEYALASNDNVGYLKIANGGDIYFKNSSREGSRSLDSVTSMLFDESAFVENIAQIYAASSPSSALVQNIQRFIVSTPSAKSGWYWDKLSSNNGNIDIESLSEEVSEGKRYRDIPGMYWFIDSQNCCKVILHYSVHPLYKTIPNYLEYRLEQDGTSEETVQREYNLRFIDTSLSVFDFSLVRKCAVGRFEEYDSTASYYAGLDCSTVGTDYTSFPILKYQNGKLSLVHLYRKRKETSDYHMFHIGELIKRYHIKTVGIEVTGGVGQLYLEQLERQFPKVLFESIRTTGDSKPIMISNLQLALEREQLIYPTGCAIVEELLSFRRSGKRLEAATGKHDDVVMGCSFGVSVTPLFTEKKQGIFGNDIFKSSLHLG